MHDPARRGRRNVRPLIWGLEKIFRVLSRQTGGEKDTWRAALGFPEVLSRTLTSISVELTWLRPKNYPEVLKGGEKITGVPAWTKVVPFLT